MTWIIECYGVEKVFLDFWRRPKVYALKGIDLQVPSGCVLGLLGPNGAGKSTLLKILLGHLFPTKGIVKILGKDPSDVDSKRRIGYLPEYSYLYPYLTPRQCFQYFGQLQELTPQVIRLRTEQLLEMVGLPHVADRLIGEFSHGMLRRLGLALSLLHDPDLLLLDEPTAGLDPLGCREVKDLILTLAKRGKTIILTSHLLADVEEVADLVAIIYAGKIYSFGPLKELLANRQLWKIILAAPQQEEIKKEILTTISEKLPGALIQEGPANYGLEEYFLDIIHKAEQVDTASGARTGQGVAEYLRGNGTAQNSSLQINKLANLAKEQLTSSLTPQSKVQSVPVPDYPSQLHCTSAPSDNRISPVESSLGQRSSLSSLEDKRIVVDSKPDNSQKETINYELLDRLTKKCRKS